MEEYDVPPTHKITRGTLVWVQLNDYWLKVLVTEEPSLLEDGSLILRGVADPGGVCAM